MVSNLKAALDFAHPLGSFYAKLSHDFGKIKKQCVQVNSNVWATWEGYGVIIKGRTSRKPGPQDGLYSHTASAGEMGFISSEQDG